MFVIKHDVRRTVADAAAGFACVLIVVHFELREIRLDLAVARLRIQAKTSLVGYAQLNVAVPAVDLHIAQRAHAYFDGAVVILQPDVAGDLLQPDVLRARG